MFLTYAGVGQAAPSTVIGLAEVGFKVLPVVLISIAPKLLLFFITRAYLA